MANSSARSVIDVGSVIADTYKIEGLIGRGGMGAVFLASHNRLPGKKVAIKVLHAELHDEELLARFKREAQIASMLGHPNIVGVHDFNVTPDGVPYLVLDYLEGETLAHKIQRGPIPLEQVQSIMRQVGSALAAAHREGIVHRDLKPQNIFLVPTEVDGKLVEIVKVLDFGISKWRGSQTVKTQDSQLLGTPQYMAPEQATGKHDSVDARTDVFALGAIVHEMLTGQPAFAGASIPEVVFKVVYEQPAPIASNVPTTIADAVKQAMAKNADERFPSVNGFVEALTGQPVSTFRPSAIAPPEVGFASGSRRVNADAAFANTMGSGDHGPAPAPLPSAPPVDASAATVDSKSSGLVPAAPASPTAAPAPATRPAGPPLALIIGGLVAVAAGAIVFVVMSGNEDTPPPPPTVASQTPEVVKLAKPSDSPEPAAPVRPSEPAPSDAAAPASAPIDAAAEVPVEPPPAQGSAARGRTTPPKPKQPPPDVDAPEDPSGLGAQLKLAQQAFRSGNTAEALRLTNAIVNQGSGRIVGRAHVLRGMIFCATKDVENLNMETRALKAFPALQHELIAACSGRRTKD